MYRKKCININIKFMKILDFLCFYVKKFYIFWTNMCMEILQQYTNISYSEQIKNIALSVQIDILYFIFCTTI